MPRLKGRRRTYAPFSRAIFAVRSTEPSSTTTMSKRGSKARSSSMTRATDSSSLRAGTMARQRRSPRPGTSSARCSATSSAIRGDRLGLGADAEEIEQPFRAPRVGVLVEHALAGTAAELLGGGRVVEELAIVGERLVGVVGDEQL